MDLQHRLSLALIVHSVRLLFVHLLMLSSHLYRCLPLARWPSTLSSSMVFKRVLCLLTCPKYFTCLIFISFINSLFIPSFSRTLYLIGFPPHEIRHILLYIHISRASIRLSSCLLDYWNKELDHSRTTVKQSTI